MGVLKSLIDVMKSSHDSYWSTVFYCICRVDDQSLFHDFDWGVIQMSTSFFAQKYCSNYLYNGILSRENRVWLCKLFKKFPILILSPKTVQTWEAHSGMVQKLAIGCELRATIKKLYFPKKKINNINSGIRQ